MLSKLQTFCFCCNLKIGVILTGILQIVLGLLNASFWIYLVEVDLATDGCLAIAALYLLNFSLGILLLVGYCKESVRITQTWLILQTIFICGDGFFISSGLILLVGMRYTCIILPLTVVFVYTEVYLWTIVYSFSKKFKVNTLSV